MIIWNIFRIHTKKVGGFGTACRPPLSYGYGPPQWLARAKGDLMALGGRGCAF